MITVYTRETCPKCKILKARLTADGIPFKESPPIDGITSLPTLEMEDGTLQTYEYVMLWLNMVESGEEE